MITTPPWQRTYTPSADRAIRTRSPLLADSLLSLEKDGLGDDSLNLSMLSSSMASASSASTSALMLTMGKMKKKEGHGIMAKERPVDCWLEDNVLKVKGEDDPHAESWDLAICKVVPPNKLDRIKLQITSNTSGLRELRLHAHTRLEAQQWLRTIVSKQESLLVQTECTAILKRMQETHERKHRQLTHQIELLTRSSEVWEEECDHISRKMQEVCAETAAWQVRYQDLSSKFDRSEVKNHTLEEEVRVAQVSAAARVEDIESEIDEVREEANTQMEEVLQKLQHTVNQLPPGDYCEALNELVQEVTDQLELLEKHLHDCLTGQHLWHLEFARQHKTVTELAASVQAVIVNAEGDVAGFCRIPLQEFDAMQKRIKEQQHRLDDLADMDAAVRQECLDTILVLQTLQVT